MEDEQNQIPSPPPAPPEPALAPRVPAPSAHAPPAPAPRPGSDGEHQIQTRIGSTQRADRFYNDQMLDHLNERMREFVGLQEMFFLATADRNGECDSTFRAGPPGFLRVLDERTLIFPEYRGNGVHASLGNIQENPHLGIMLIDFLRARIGLHINGEAEIVTDAEIRAQHPDLPTESVPGRKAELWVKVTVEEAYIHCAKHIPHLQRAPKRASRDWGTDDYKRKGGDFFGVARDRKQEAREARSTDTRPVPPAQPTEPVPSAEPAASAEPRLPAGPAPAAEPAASAEPLVAYERATPPPPEQPPYHVPPQPVRQPDTAGTRAPQTAAGPPPATPPVPVPPVPPTSAPPTSTPTPYVPAQSSVPPLPARPPAPTSPPNQAPAAIDQPETPERAGELTRPVPDWRSEALRVLADAEARGRARELASVSANAEASGTSPADADSVRSAGEPAVHSWFGGRQAYP